MLEILPTQRFEGLFHKIRFRIELSDKLKCVCRLHDIQMQPNLLGKGIL